MCLSVEINNEDDGDGTNNEMLSLAIGMSALGCGRPMRLPVEMTNIKLWMMHLLLMPSSRLLTAFNHNHHDFTFIPVLIYSRFLFFSGIEKLYKKTNTNMSEEEKELLARIGQLAGSCPPSIDFTRNFKLTIFQVRSTATRTSKQEYGRSHPTTHRIIEVSLLDKT